MKKANENSPAMPDQLSVYREWKRLTDQQKNEVLTQFKVTPEGQKEFVERPGIYILCVPMDRRRSYWIFQQQNIQNTEL